MGFYKENIKEPYECPESEMFLDNDEIMRGHKMYFQMQECIHNFNWGKCGGSCEQGFLNNSQYSYLLEYALSDGFTDYSKLDTNSNNGLITTTMDVVQGYLIAYPNSRHEN